MEGKWLEDFLSVARTGNFSSSADERHVTQSAFSRRIKALEQWVGVALIDRSSYPTRLTPAGEQFRDVASAALSSLQRSRQDLRQAFDAGCRPLRVSVQHSLAGEFLARWVAGLPLPQEARRIRAKADNLHDCVREMEEGNADVLICYAHPELPLKLDEERYAWMNLADEKLTAYCRPDDAGAPLYPIKPGVAQSVPLLAYSRDAFLGRAAMLAIEPLRKSADLATVFDCALADALRAAAVAGLGVAWLPTRLVKSDVLEGRLVRAGDPSIDVLLQLRLYAQRATLVEQRPELWRAIRTCRETDSRSVEL